MSSYLENIARFLFFLSEGNVFNKWPSHEEVIVVADKYIKEHCEHISNAFLVFCI